jgi:hypothetical protein
MTYITEQNAYYVYNINKFHAGGLILDMMIHVGITKFNLHFLYYSVPSEYCNSF